jgi:hypothetical protein
MLHAHAPYHTNPHILPPLLPWPHTLSHPLSLSYWSDVSWSKMPAGSTLIALPFRSRYLGTRRGGSQPSHTAPAHARCVHKHAHACAPCTCPMHMHVCTVALSRSAYAHTMHVCMYMHMYMHMYMNEYVCVCVFVFVCVCVCMCLCV